jgi:hypothetical protein
MKAQSQLIKAQIAKTAVRAPFSGRIGLRSISVGTYITPAILVANLVNIGKLKITFSIPEKYANQIKKILYLVLKSVDLLKNIRLQSMPSNLPLKSQLEHYKFVRLLRTKTESYYQVLLQMLSCLLMLL